ncbi:transcriptional repressor NrdR [Candidatus Daviesbacteria bacterium]|nr:transcriptional repressor NrdR [Candidatus Daviesbacteria bacterium]
MNCPFCKSNQSAVLDKRDVKGTGEIRRRRKCLKCKRRYTTYERALVVEMAVIKRDGKREAFDINKVRSGLIKALEKRPAFENLEAIVGKIERKIRSKDKSEIESKVIGREVLAELKKVDPVAYLRFVSVYRQFKVPSDFSKELEMLTKNI